MTKLPPISNIFYRFSYSFQCSTKFHAAVLIFPYTLYFPLFSCSYCLFNFAWLYQTLFLLLQAHLFLISYPTILILLSSLDPISLAANLHTFSLFLTFEFHLIEFVI